MSNMDELQKGLGYTFKNSDLLRTALTHRSHSYERSSRATEDYERLEFLGDALLGFLVADWLFKDDDSADEGVLSRRRQIVVRASTLATAGRRLGLGDSILLGKGEELTGGRRKGSLLADLFEAVLGAIYLDGGLRPARAFVRRHLGEIMRGTRSSGGSADDFKTRLQERTQAELQMTPPCTCWSGSRAILLYAPRSLNEKTDCRSSRFMRTRLPRRCERFSMRHRI